MAEVGEMGHPAKDSGKCVDNARCFKIFSKLLKRGIFGQVSTFLGGLSLHLNRLIGSRVTNYDWPFWTLPFGLFGSNLDTRDLETYPRTYSGHF